MQRTQTQLQEIVDDFELLGDWESRYQYLVELGEQLPPMPPEAKTDGNKVKGCVSQVWTLATRDPDDLNVVRFQGDCNTSIIKGVLALLIQLADGRDLAAVEKLDVDELFERLNLDEHLSPNRHVGVYAVVEQMKRQAAELLQTARNAANA